MPSYLITGASRGLGLSFAKELLQDPANKVIATARNTAGAAGLQGLAAQYPRDRLVLLDLDVTKDNSIENLAAEIDTVLPDGLDNLISNAGLNPQPLASFEDLDLASFEEELVFSIISTVKLLRALLPSVKKGNDKKILVLSSVLGSIETAYHMPGLSNPYSVAKASLNMLIRKWSATLKNDGITTILVHPGWVKTTEVGDAIKPWMDKYAPNMLRDATIKDNGSFFNYDGNLMAW
ncbi:hypothetical protein TARUN_3312 [Trichoderma arundinaceum]|uniref:Short-chain dehydrogenase reductase sdr n=1 Tax=Trichoderma arundinaceum TaxID=490622 RepID=A0A395NS63_TRIAR|nr:hypothetical protein TARUN_3312 [Trichoderma arundinaceum]